jgi:hypothetical protein
MAEAGFAQADEAFEVEAFARAFAVFDRILESSATTFDAEFRRRGVDLRFAPAQATLVARIATRLRERLPHLEVTQTPFESRYYDGIRGLFSVNTPSGDACQIGDIGAFDWIGKLTSNARHRFVAAGFGLQLIAMLFGR